MLSLILKLTLLFICLLTLVGIALFIYAIKTAVLIDDTKEI